MFMCYYTYEVRTWSEFQPFVTSCLGMLGRPNTIYETKETHAPTHLIPILPVYKILPKKISFLRNTDEVETNENYKQNFQVY